MLFLIRHLAFPTFLLLCSIDQRLTDQKCDTRLSNDAICSFEMLMQQFQFPALFQNAKQMRARISKYQLHVNQLTFALLTIYKKGSGKSRCESNSKWNTTFSVVPAKLSGSNGTCEKASSPVVPNRNSCAISSTLFDGLILRLDTVTF